MKNILKILVILIFSSVSANAIAIDSAMQDETKAFLGQPIQKAIKKWGNPTDIEQQCIYNWSEPRMLVKVGSKYISVKNRFITAENAKNNNSIYKSLRTLEIDSNGIIIGANAYYIRYESEGMRYTNSSTDIYPED